MTASPQVSIVMSVYNGAESLRDSVESVLSQEGVDFEFIIVNDGSTDASASMLDSIAAADSRIRLLHQANQGLTKALINGCALARGEYIARQDCGDRSLENRLLVQKQALDKCTDLSFVSCWTEACGPKREFLSLSKGTGRAASPTAIISLPEKYGVIDGPTWHPSVMFRKDRYHEVGGYRRQFYFGQDWDLWYRLGEVGKFQMIEQVLYQACVEPNSLSGRHRTQQQDISKLSHQMLIRRNLGQTEADLLALAQKIRPTARAPEASAAIKAAGLYFIGEQLRRNADGRCESYLREALSLHPTMLRAWLRLGQFFLTSKP